MEAPRLALLGAADIVGEAEAAASAFIISRTSKVPMTLPLNSERRAGSQRSVWLYSKLLTWNI